MIKRFASLFQFFHTVLSIKKHIKKTDVFQTAHVISKRYVKKSNNIFSATNSTEYSINLRQNFLIFHLT